MIALVTLFLIVTIAVIVTRVAAVALTHTGLSPDVARFQARSAFMGVGFTTTESEFITRHPLRREIIFKLMLLGNAGIVTAITTLVIGFVHVAGAGDLLSRIGLLGAGMGVLFFIASSRRLDDLMSRAILWGLKRYTRLDLLDYTDLLHLSGGYRVTRIQVAAGTWLDGKQLKDLGLPGRGLQILGISRPDGEYVGAPGGQTEISAGDTLVLYGQDRAIASVDWKGPP